MRIALKIDVEKYYISRITLKIDVEKYNILRIALKIDDQSGNILRITLKLQFVRSMSLRITLERIHNAVCGSKTTTIEIYGILRIVLTNILKAAAGTEYVGAPPCLQAITCTLFAHTL